MATRGEQPPQAKIDGMEQGIFPRRNLRMLVMLVKRGAYQDEIGAAGSFGRSFSQARRSSPNCRSIAVYPRGMQ